MASGSVVPSVRKMGVLTATFHNWVAVLEKAADMRVSLNAETDPISVVSLGKSLRPPWK